jgi:hypothetical protein
VSTWEFDTNGDGLVDQRAFDLDGSGVADFWHIDSLGDGYFDQVAHDSSGSGYADTWFLDPDLDGLVDEVQYDTIGDGSPDTVDHSQAGTSMGWEALAQPVPQPPHGGVAIIGGNTEPSYTITDQFGNPVPNGGMLDSVTIGGSTPLPPLHQMLVQAQESGDWMSFLQIQRLIDSQNFMVDMALLF